MKKSVGRRRLRDTVRSLRANPLLMQVVGFGIVGVFAALVNVGVYWIGAQVLDVNPNLAWCAGFIIAVIVSFQLQRRFVFFASQKQSAVSSGSRYLLAALMGFAVNSFWVWSLVTWMHFPTWAPIPMILFATPMVTFSLNRFWVFR